jgi:hypothetical protein
MLVSIFKISKNPHNQLHGPRKAYVESWSLHSVWRNELPYRNGRRALLNEDVGLDRERKYFTNAYNTKRVRVLFFHC